MKKTSYYKSDKVYTHKDGTRTCQWCHKTFTPSSNPKSHGQKYCSKECYEESRKLYTKLWYNEHKEKQKAYYRKYYREHPQPPKPKVEQITLPETLRPIKDKSLFSLSTLRTGVIKQELAKLGLLNGMIEKLPQKVNYMSFRKTHPEYAEVIEFIKDELAKKKLYEEHDIEVDYSDDTGIGDIEYF